MKVVAVRGKTMLPDVEDTDVFEPAKYMRAVNVALWKFPVGF